MMLVPRPKGVYETPYKVPALSKDRFLSAFVPLLWGQGRKKGVHYGSGWVGNQGSQGTCMNKGYVITSTPLSHLKWVGVAYGFPFNQPTNNWVASNKHSSPSTQLLLDTWDFGHGGKSSWGPGAVQLAF